LVLFRYKGGKVERIDTLVLRPDEGPAHKIELTGKKDGIEVVFRLDPAPKLTWSWDR
jgi:hypothetical protein